MTPAELIRLHFQKQSDAIAMIDGEVEITYQKLFVLILPLRKYLRDLQIDKQARIALIAEINIRTILFLFALWEERHPVALLSPKETEAVLREKISLISPRIVFADTTSKRELHLEDLSPLPEVLWEALSSSDTEVTAQLDDAATIIFSSGTAGQPKGVIHTFSNHYYSALGANEHLPLIPGDRWLLSLPIYHVGGLAVLYRTLLAGSTVVLPDSSRSLYENITAYNITHLSLVPAQLKTLVATGIRPPSLKAILVGGADCPVSLLETALEKNFPVFTTYGNTEAASQITTMGEGRQEEHIAEAGTVLSYRELKIAHDDEICVKGHTVARNTLTGELPVDADGWYHTGDLGNMSKDGYLSVYGRKDNMFISGGENIYPEEIETVLAKLLPDSESLVVAVTDDKFGQRPVAFIKGEYSEPALHAEMLKLLPAFKIPDYFFPWPENDSLSGIKPNRAYFKDIAKELLADS